VEALEAYGTKNRRSRDYLAIKSEGVAVARKTKVANDELVRIFYERLREAPAPQLHGHTSIAIVPSEAQGWTAAGSGAEN
jgi:hypothetical protein